MEEIKVALEDVVKETLKELERQGRLKNPYEKSPYKKTETLLYNLSKFYASLEFHKNQIKTIREYGLPKRSHSVPTYLSNGTLERKDARELIESKIAEEEKIIYRTEILLETIERAIETVSDEKGIGYCLFVENRSTGEIMDALGVSASTISKEKAKFIREVSVVLFPDGALDELLYDKGMN